MAESKAQALAAGFSTRKQRVDEDDLKGSGLPPNLREGILAVEEASHNLAQRVAFAEALHATQPAHELALEPGNHRQTTWAQRFEMVGDEVVEITKESAESPVKLTYRPDLKAGAQVDPLSALQAQLQGEQQPVEVEAPEPDEE